jgi:hypothetical protein
VKLLIDHHYAAAIATQLRSRGHEVDLAVERGWHTEDDEILLELCAGEGRALLTNNVADFSVIAARWVLEGRRHAGLIFTSDRSLPRSRHTIGTYVTKLDEFLLAHPVELALEGQATWLG